MIWSYVMGLRRRWTGLNREASFQQREEGEPGGGGRESIKDEFLRREPVIDCPHEGCGGMLVTGRREVSRWGRTGSRVVLRCTRRPGDHDFTLSVEPFTTEEVERLRIAASRGERLDCARCGTLLEPSGASATADGVEGSRASVYDCRWCGLKWLPGGDLQRQAS